MKKKSVNTGLKQTVKPKLVDAGLTRYAHFEEADGNVETLTLTQNLEVSGHDHWLIEFSLSRWRSKKILAAYLRTIADIVDGA